MFLSASPGTRLLPHAVPLRRRWNADIRVKARPPQAEYPEEHLCYGALQEHGQESHHRGPQHCPGHTAPEQHHVGHTVSSHHSLKVYISLEFKSVHYNPTC